jgi:hypothetical protein
MPQSGQMPTEHDTPKWGRVIEVKSGLSGVAVAVSVRHDETVPDKIQKHNVALICCLIDSDCEKTKGGVTRERD